MRRRRAEAMDYRMQVEVGTAQWAGTRPSQNDVLSVLTHGDESGICVMMADGIGTDALAGSAAQTAVQAMQQAYSTPVAEETPLLRSIRIVGSAHRAVLRLNGLAMDRGQMTTGASVACVLARGERVSFSSVGNVRLFLYRMGVLLQLNRDFLLSTETETQEILDGNADPRIDPDWNLRLIAYAGMDGLRELDWPGEELILVPGDQILMISSGMYGALSEKEWDEILEVLPPQRAAEEAVARVQEKQNQSQSNVSVAILRFS